MKKHRFENVKALTFASIMSAISIVLILFSHFVGDIGILLMLFLPLCAALVSVCVDFKHSLIYVVSTFLISCIDFQLALFIVIPSLIAGYIYGKLINVYVQGHYIILINSLILLILQFLATYLINFIYQIDFVYTLAQIIRISESTFKDTYLLFLFLISLIQCSLSYTIITSEFKKFDIEFNEKKNKFTLNITLEGCLILFSVLFMFVYAPIGYLLLGVSIYMGIVVAYYNFSYYKRNIIVPLQLVLYFISLVLMLVLLSYVKVIYQPYLVLIPLISQLGVSSFIIFYQKVIKKSKITPCLFDKLD